MVVRQTRESRAPPAARATLGAGSGPTRESQDTQPSELRFRALLSEGDILMFFRFDGRLLYGRWRQDWYGVRF